MHVMQVIGNYMVKTQPEKLQIVFIFGGRQNRCCRVENNLIRPCYTLIKITRPSQH